MNKKRPRWINEIPGIILTGEDAPPPTEEMKRKSKEFEEAVKSGKIDEWFEKGKTS